MREWGERKREEGGREGRGKHRKGYLVPRPEGWEVYELVFITTLVQSRYMYVYLSQYTVHCCSTLEERAHRLFMTKGVVLESLDPSQFAKSRNPHKRDTERQVEVGLLEAQVYRYAELLGVSEGVWCEGVIV